MKKQIFAFSWRKMPERRYSFVSIISYKEIHNSDVSTMTPSQLALFDFNIMDEQTF